MGYQDTSLWNRTLGEAPNDRWVRERAIRRQAFESLRANMRWFLENIGSDLPHFTVHDMTLGDHLQNRPLAITSKTANGPSPGHVLFYRAGKSVQSGQVQAALTTACPAPPVRPTGTCSETCRCETA
jgi:hypothetical protein